MHTYFAPLLMQATDSWFSPKGIFASLPTDPASIFTLIFLGVAVALLAWYGRPRKKGGGSH